MILAVKTRPRSKKVYRFKITLAVIKPPIWRRVEVPGNYSFWDFHVAITDCFGWLDYHLHQFEIVNPKTGETEQIGMPDPEMPEVLPDWRRKISRYFTPQNPKAVHSYDFGDG